MRQYLNLLKSPVLLLSRKLEHEGCEHGVGGHFQRSKAVSMESVEGVNGRQTFNEALTHERGV